MRFGDLLVLIIVASVLALGSAKVSEIVLNLPPCKLCYYQRYIFGTLIIACSLFFFKDYKFIKITTLLALIMLSAGLAFYHFGVEQKWFYYESECTTGFSKAHSFLEYKKMLKAKEIVFCDQSIFEFLGISMAGWNFIYSSVLLLITIVVCIKNNWFKNEESKTAA